jgi:Helix-turn-helix domain
MGHARPGPAPQTEKREWFARLIAGGVSNAEACRIVGVNPRTGKRWRHGRTITSGRGVRLHYPPVIAAGKPEISARYLSEDERVRIADLHRAGHAVRAIATEVSRSPGTVSRELRRNRDPDGGGVPTVHRAAARCPAAGPAGARSRMPTSPTPRGRLPGSNPCPSSVTNTVRVPSCSCTRTCTADGDPWRQAFVSASCTIRFRVSVPKRRKVDFFLYVADVDDPKNADMRPFECRVRPR